MADETVERSSNVATAAIEGHVADVVRFVAAEFGQLNSGRASFNDDEIEEVTAKAVSYFKRQNRASNVGIDELSFDALQIAMDVANIRAAKEAEDLGLPPAGWVA